MSDNMVLEQKTDKALWAHVGNEQVSILDQDPAPQLDALSVAGCSKVFKD
jgi:hypothetical protein